MNVSKVLQISLVSQAFHCCLQRSNLIQMLNMDVITPNTSPLTLHHSQFICFHFLLPWTRFIKAEV